LEVRDPKGGGDQRSRQSKGWSWRGKLQKETGKKKWKKKKKNPDLLGETNPHWEKKKRKRGGFGQLTEGQGERVGLDP